MRLIVVGGLEIGTIVGHLVGVRRKNVLMVVEAMLDVVVDNVFTGVKTVVVCNTIRRSKLVPDILLEGFVAMGRLHLGVVLERLGLRVLPSGLG